MDTVTIISKEEISLDTIRAQLEGSKLGGAAHIVNQKDPVVVEEGNSRVYIHHPQGAMAEEKNLSQLYLDYSSLDLVKRVVVIIADNPDLTVKNDYGTALPGDKFVAWIKSTPGLIWRVHHS